jgi:hypothetical protein
MCQDVLNVSVVSVPPKTTHAGRKEVPIYLEPDT